MALLDRLISLPPPAPGRLRVYRGQTRDYGSMLPAALRPGFTSRDTRLRHYASIAAPELRDAAGEGAPTDIDVWTLWSYAIAQHYGPGTHYLDVTKSLDVAVWFALHEPDAKPMLGAIGPPGPLDPATDRFIAENWVSFRPCDTGFLYVFDLEAWDLAGAPHHGALVDLSSAPWMFRTSQRMNAQEGCLIKAQPAVDGGDLIDLLTCEPIQVQRDDARPMGQDDLFPDAASDPWYDRFVSLPFVPWADPATVSVRFERPVPVTIYASDSDAHLEAIASRLVILEPPLLWPYVKQESAAPGSWVPAGFRPDDAVHILIEFPVYAITPPLEGPVPMWNEGVAVADLPNSCPTVDLASGSRFTTPLSRVIFGFSPLELGVWNAVGTSGETRSYLRGLYVQREDPKLLVWPIYQDVPHGSLTIAGPLDFALDIAVNSLVGPALPIARKGLLAALTILRELSSEPLVCPFPMLIAGSKLVLRVQGGSTLLRVPAPGGDQIDVVRDPNNEPFDASHPAMGFVSFDTDRPWASCDPVVIGDFVRNRASPPGPGVDAHP